MPAARATWTTRDRKRVLSPPRADEVVAYAILDYICNWETGRRREIVSDLVLRAPDGSEREMMQDWDPDEWFLMSDKDVDLYEGK